MQETTQLEPKNSDIQYNIGVINMQQGNILELAKSLKKLLELSPIILMRLLTSQQPISTKEML